MNRRAGVDGGVDAGVDGGVGAGVDGGVGSGVDDGVGADVDGGMGAAVDKGAGSGEDGGPGAGVDNGEGAGVDRGAGAGADGGAGVFRGTDVNGPTSAQSPSERSPQALKSACMRRETPLGCSTLGRGCLGKSKSRWCRTRHTVILLSVSAGSGVLATVREP